MTTLEKQTRFEASSVNKVKLGDQSNKQLIENNKKQEWKPVKLGDVVKSVQINEYEPEKAGLTRYVAGEHIESENLFVTKYGEIRKAKEVIGSAFIRRFSKGQILYGTRRAYLRKSAIATFDGICANTTLTLEVNDEGLIPDLLPFLLQSDKFVNYAIKCSVGSTNPYVRWRDLADFKFLLPPIEIQQKASNILWSVENALGNSENLLQKTIQLQKISLNQLFTNGTSKIKFKQRTLGSVITLQRGHDLPNHMRKIGAIPIIGSNGIVGYHDEYKAKGPGVVIGRSGTIGKVYFVEDDYWPLNTSLYVKEFHSSYPKFVYYLLQTIDYEKFNAGTSVPTLNRNYLHPLKISIPDNITEQQEIVDILDKTNDEILKMNRHIEKLKQLRKNLSNNLLYQKHSQKEKQLVH